MKPTAEPTATQVKAATKPRKNNFDNLKTDKFSAFEVYDTKEGEIGEFSRY